MREPAYSIPEGREDAEPRAGASEPEDRGRRYRGCGQAQDTAQQPGAAVGGSQRGKPGRVAERHFGQVGDESAAFVPSTR
jgi:hypothetical protein